MPAAASEVTSQAEDCSYEYRPQEKAEPPPQGNCQSTLNNHIWVSWFFVLYLYKARFYS